MNTKREYRRTEHSVYLCDYHIVFPTKYRKKAIDDTLWKYLYANAGINTDIIQKYIAKQGEEDAGQTATLFD